MIHEYGNGAMSRWECGDGDGDGDGSMRDYGIGSARGSNLQCIPNLISNSNLNPIKEKEKGKEEQKKEQ